MNGSIGTRVRSAIACEQALLFGPAKCVSRERASERAAKPRGAEERTPRRTCPSLARSREAHPNRRACSQARSANTADTPCRLGRSAKRP